MKRVEFGMIQQSLGRQARRAQAGLKSVGAALTDAARLAARRNRPSHAHEDIALKAVPGCLRGGDAFAGHAIVRGIMRHGQAVVDLKEARPFAKLPTGHAITAYVDTLAWLADLKAANKSGHAQASAEAICQTGGQLLNAWLAARGELAQGTAAAPRLQVERLRISLANGDVLLAGCDGATFDSFHEIIANDIAALEAHVANGKLKPELKARALLALVMAGLVLEGCEALVDTNEAALVASLDSALRPDGSPPSRSRDDAIDIVLDLIPVLRMYSYADRPAPSELTGARQRVMRYLKTLHIAGPSFVSFGAVEGAADLDVARVLKLETHARPHTHAENAGIVRCERGAMTLFADAGGDGLDGMADVARQSIGAVEIAFGHRSVITTQQSRPATCQRAQHHYSALHLEAIATGQAAAAAAAQAGRVVEFRNEPDDDAELTITHDRFMQTHGLLHTRAFTVSADGSAIKGRERLCAAQGAVRFSRDVPLVVHFQLATEIAATVTGTPGEIALRLPEGATLVFASTSGQVSLETRTALAPDGSQRTAWIIALRKTTDGETELSWSLTLQDENGGSVDEPTRVVLDATASSA
jgi:uncharacterized heparinase superfamily protein